MTIGKPRPWLLLALITTLFWGIWGAFIEIPGKAGFPATLGYVAWAITMIPCAIYALNKIKWSLETDWKSILLGLIVGLTGAGGQLILFQAVREGPAYIIFPVISMFPIVTIFLSAIFLKETASRKSWIGIILAIIAIALLSYQEPGQDKVNGYLWLFLASLVFLLWGVQGFFMKFSNSSMQAESIFFYMMISAVILIPVAILMTDFSIPVNWGFKGPYLATMVHLLNSIGALTLVYALRYGKAIIVVPLTGLSPVITIIVSLVIYAVFPHPVIICGLILAVIAMFLLSD